MESAMFFLLIFFFVSCFFCVESCFRGAINFQLLLVTCISETENIGGTKGPISTFIEMPFEIAAPLREFHHNYVFLRHCSQNPLIPHTLNTRLPDSQIRSFFFSYIKIYLYKILFYYSFTVCPKALTFYEDPVALVLRVRGSSTRVLYAALLSVLYEDLWLLKES